MADQAQIPIWSKGEIVAAALVDAEDYDRLAEHVWYLSGDYAVRYEKHRDPTRKSGWRTVAVGMHRDVLGITGSGPLVHGDHLKGRTLDNRKSELRIATPSQNRINSRAVSSTGVKNVSVRPDGKFEARVNLGLFDTIEQAATEVEKFNLWAERTVR